jgi:hypothetical protein
MQRQVSTSLVLPFTCALMLLNAMACSDDKPAHSNGADKTAGAESDIDEAHRNFQEAVKPAATEVDRVANEAVDESKKAVRKVTGTDNDTE